MDEATLRQALQEVNSDKVDVLVQAGTNLSMVRLADEAERWLNKPVIAVNAATWWMALRDNGINDKLEASVPYSVISERGDRTAMRYGVIIVGAGSAGCVLAARLSENRTARCCSWRPARTTPFTTQLPDEIKNGYNQIAAVPGAPHNWSLVGTPTPNRAGQMPVPPGKAGRRLQRH